MTAHPQVQKVWNARYLVPGSRISDALADGGSCYVCHAKNRRPRYTPYGQAWRTLLTKDDRDDAARIDAAFGTVANQHVGPDDKTSPTFGDLIENGTLPLRSDDP